MSISDRITNPNNLVEKQGAKLLIYGAAGAGKTTACASAPGKTLIISMEAGLLSIKGASNLDAIEVKEASDVEEIAVLLENGQLDYDTVCLDSVTEMSEILLASEKLKSKDPRRAYGEVIDVMTRTMKRFRDLKMHVIFVAKEDKVRDEQTGAFHYQPMMVGAKLSQQIPYLYDGVFVLRIFEGEENEQGKKVPERWLQTVGGANYIAKDRSGKLDDFEAPNLSVLIKKLGFDIGEEKNG
jgi:phage nucleotide-binding protein